MGDGVKSVVRDRMGDMCEERRMEELMKEKGG